MRFRKPIGAKPLNLPKTTFGKISFIATLCHASDHFVVKPADFAMFFKCGHGPAQLVCFATSKASRDHRNLHGLFLK